MKDKVINPIILLSGPVGAGKTTMAQSLLKSAVKPTVYIEGDTFWGFIIKQTETIGRHRNFRTTMSSMMAASVPYALNGYEVILDFSIPPWFLDTARKIAGMRNIPLEYVVMLPSEKTCAERAASRKEGTISDYSFYHDFYLDFNEIEERHIIRDDINEVDVVAEKIQKHLTEGLFRLS